MSLTVKDLNKIVVNKARLDEVTKSQLATIDKKINEAALNGINQLTYTLPVTFMSGVTSDRNILLVHVQIIKSLETRGFNVKYVDNGRAPVIVINWILEDDVQIDTSISKFLKSRSYG